MTGVPIFSSSTLILKYREILLRKYMYILDDNRCIHFKIHSVHIHLGYMITIRRQAFENMINMLKVDMRLKNEVL